VDAHRGEENNDANNVWNFSGIGINADYYVEEKNSCKQEMHIHD
jgi:hypothetical protein